MEHIRDKDVKKAWIHPGQVLKYKGMADGGGITLQGIPWSFEYENSSRGLVTHLAAYLKGYNSTVQPKAYVILISSDKHKTTHKRDLVLAQYLATTAPAGLAFIFTSLDSDTSETLTDYLTKFISTH